MADNSRKSYKTQIVSYYILTIKGFVRVLPIFNVLATQGLTLLNR